MYDLAVIGGGPGGVAAGVYAARKKIKTIFITESFGGQSVVSDDIHNWIGTKSIAGWELAQNLENHLKVYKEDLDIKEGRRIYEVLRKETGGFLLKTQSGEEFEAKNILIASGSRHKKLEVPGEKEFDGKGVAYCSTCDAPIFRGKDVAVVGGGNAGAEAVLDLLPYASKIYWLVRSDIKADAITAEKAKQSPKVQILQGVSVAEIGGGAFVEYLNYKDSASQLSRLEVGGVFVEIGATPNSDFVKNLVSLDGRGHIMVDHKTFLAAPGIWAVGDVCDSLYKQNNISAGEGVVALLNIYDKLIKE